MGANKSDSPNDYSMDNLDADIKQDGTTLSDENEDNLLTQEEHDILDDVEENETPEDSQPEENKEEGKSPSDEGGDSEEEDASEDNTQTEEENKPFHEHPRFKELIKEKNELKEKLESIDKDYQDKFSKIDKEVEAKQIPEWFVKLYGENEEAWTIYDQQRQTDRAQLKEEIKADEETARQKAEDATKANDEWVNSNIQTLKDEGHDFDRNKFLKFMIEYKPTDDKGGYDFKKGIDLYEKVNAPSEKKPDAKLKAKKSLADITTNQGKSDTTVKKYLTPNDLRFKTFDTLSRED